MNSHFVLFQRSTVREKATKTIIGVGIGWKEYDAKQKCYKQVRSQSGGGTLFVRLNRNTDYISLLEICKEKFFPNGRSANGIETRSREFFLGSNQGMDFGDSFNLSELYKENNKLKVYLHSKQVGTLLSSFKLRKAWCHFHVLCN